jgi:ribonuclease Z
VVGHGGPGVGNGLILFTDHHRYLFNCGESVQRLSAEHCHFNVMLRLENIFVTSRTWKNLGGLLVSLEPILPTSL